MRLDTDFKRTTLRAIGEHEGAINHFDISIGQTRFVRRLLIGAVAELVGIECGVVSGVFNLELSGIEVPDWRPRHDKHYHEA